MLLRGCQIDVRRKLAKLIPAACALAMTVMVVSDSWAQNADPMVLPPQPEPEISGPATVELGAVARFQLPEGYKFLAPGSAILALNRDGNLAPKNLVGLMVSEYGGSAIRFEYAPIGHVQEGDPVGMDHGVLLEKFRERDERQNRARVQAGLVPNAKIEWHSKPIYSTNNHTLEWAFSAETAGLKSVNHTIAFLGRRGVLVATILAKADAEAKLLALRDVAHTVAFVENEGYLDYRSKDPLARGTTVQNLIALDLDNAKPALAASGSSGTLWALIALGCVAAFGSALIVLKIRHAKPANSQEAAVVEETKSKSEIMTPSSEPTPRQVPLVTQVPARPRAPLMVKSNGSGARRSLPKVQRTNGHDRQPKKRVFDYNRYFADLMSSVSGHSSYGPEAGGRQGMSLENLNLSDTNGSAHANGNGNGNGNGSSNGSNHVNAAEIQAQMISTQKSLIEEQRRLIQEQSKLIEEKTRLIAEKNLILDRQTELLDQKLLNL